MVGIQEIINSFGIFWMAYHVFNFANGILENIKDSNYLKHFFLCIRRNDHCYISE